MANTNKTKRTKKQRRFTKTMQIKLLAIFAFILLFLVILLLRIAYINVHSGKKYAKQVLSQANYDSRTLASRRGEIQDTNGRVIAYSEKQYNVVLDCSAVNQDEDYLEPTVRALNEVFDLDKSEMKDRITGEKTKDSQYQVVLKNITQDQKDAYEEYVSVDEERNLTKEERQEHQNVQGIYFEEVFVRKYPLDSVASTVVGFSNSIGDGISGIESYYDSLLKGTNGRVFGYLNENQEYQKKTIVPQNGYTIKTTLDLNIQQVVEKYIREFDEEYGTDEDNGTAKHGAKDIGVIAMDPNSGAILAMATNHSYNLNDPQNLDDWYTKSEQKSMSDEEYVEALNTLWKNYCVTDGIEPGSTFKPMTIAAALECGAITENSSFYCDGGEQVTDTYIRCDVWPGAHGEETLGDVLKNSCNDGLMQIGAAMGVSKYIEYQSMFNFGYLTGIDLPNEAGGSVYTQERMNEVELATCTFGQGFTCTMIQEIAAFCSVVNGGNYYQPHVMERVLDENGKVIRSNSGLLLKQTVSAGVSELLRGYLETTVEEGTGKKAQVPGYRIGGKTGTAEKIDYTTGTRAAGKYLVSFIGAVPIDDPQVVIYVVVDEPNVSDQAHSTYAQEVFRKIATEVLPYMKIYPTEAVTDELLASLGLIREDLGENAVQVFDAIDSNGNYHTDARIQDGKIVDGDGNVIEGAYINEENHVIDAVGNDVFTIEGAASILDSESKADNPDMAVPPTLSDDAADNSTVWDGTALGDDSSSGNTQ